MANKIIRILKKHSTGILYYFNRHVELYFLEAQNTKIVTECYNFIHNLGAQGFTKYYVQTTRFIVRPFRTHTPNIQHLQKHTMLSGKLRIIQLMSVKMFLVRMLTQL